MRKLFFVEARPWIGNRIVSTYRVCANSSADAKAAVKKQPEISSFLYNDNDIKVVDNKREKDLCYKYGCSSTSRTEGWKTNEVRRCD